VLTGTLSFGAGFRNTPSVWLSGQAAATAGLSIVAAGSDGIARIGAQLPTIDADTGAAIIAAGLLTVVLFPRWR